MKKNVFFLLCFILALLAACQQKTPKDNDYLNPIVDDDPCLVDSADFRKLVEYIEEKGSVVYQNNLPCDYQLNFLDSEKHRHVLTTIRRDINGNPDLNGKVNEISVWIYQQDFMFCYIITADLVEPMMQEDFSNPEHLAIMNLGYNEFLSKVNSSLNPAKKSKNEKTH
jgi:hypothetical protein